MNNKTVWEQVARVLIKNFKNSNFTKVQADEIVKKSLGKNIKANTWSALLNRQIITKTEDNNDTYVINTSSDTEFYSSPWLDKHDKSFTTFDNKKGIATFFSEKDIPTITFEYFVWKEQCKRYNEMGFRRPNVPEIVSEGLTCALMKLGRVNNKELKGFDSSSFDAIDVDTSTTIQIKAVSCKTASDLGGPSSFGPRSEFDRLVFLYINLEEDTAYFYEPDEKDVNNYQNWKISETQTLGDKQKNGERPRLKIRLIIKELGLSPFLTFKFEKPEGF